MPVLTGSACGRGQQPTGRPSVRRCRGAACEQSRIPHCRYAKPSKSARVCQQPVACSLSPPTSCCEMPPSVAAQASRSSTHSSSSPVPVRSRRRRHVPRHQHSQPLHCRCRCQRRTPWQTCWAWTSRLPRLSRRHRRRPSRRGCSCGPARSCPPRTSSGCGASCQQPPPSPWPSALRRRQRSATGSW